jgi:hypothetical protein
VYFLNKKTVNVRNKNQRNENSRIYCLRGGDSINIYEEREKSIGFNLPE